MSWASRDLWQDLPGRGRPLVEISAASGSGLVVLGGKARNGRCYSIVGMERPELEARTAAFAAAVFALTNVVRLKPGGRQAADQLLDCATSIGAHYRASARARSRDEFIAKLGTVNEIAILR